MAGSSFGDDTSVSGTLAVIEEQGSAPSAPAAGSGGILYTKADGKIYWISDDVSETDLTSGGGAVSAVANGSDNRIVTFSSSDALNGESNMTYDGTTITLNDNVKTGGGMNNAVVAAKTGNATLSVDEHIVPCDPSSGAFTLTLPAVSGIGGTIFVIKNKTSSTNAITIDGDSSETIDDETTIALTQPYASVTLFCDGSEWWII